MASELPSKPIRSLQLLCQIEVVKNLYTKATSLERDYFDDFCGNLIVSHQKLEQEIDVRPETLDPAKIVIDFERKKAERDAEEAQKKLKGQRNIKIVSAANQSPKRLRSSTRKSKKPYETLIETTPISANLVVEVEKKVHPTTHLMRIAHLKELGKIPKGFTAADYIRYRKCKFIQEIDAVRQYLQVIYFILSFLPRFLTATYASLTVFGIAFTSRRKNSIFTVFRHVSNLTSQL